MTKRISPRDLEALSAYMDGELSQKELALLETRLESSIELQAAYEELRRTRVLLKTQPRLRAPRNFTLTAEMAGVRAKSPSPATRLFPVFRLTAALASILFVLVVIGDFLLGTSRIGGVPMAAEPALQVMEMEADIETLESQESVAEAEPVLEAPAAPVEKVVEEPVVESDQAADEPLRMVIPEAAEAGPPTTEGIPLEEELATQDVLEEGSMVVQPTPTPQMELAPPPLPVEETQVVGRLPEIGDEPEGVGVMPTSRPAPNRSAWRLVEGLLIIVALVSGLVAIFLHRGRRV